MWAIIRSTIVALLKGIGAFGLSGLILWQVVIHIGPQYGIAYVHVPKPNVDVMVDDANYHIDTVWDTPIVCELSPGAHILRMRRDGRVVYEENFSLGVGQEIVLTAYEPPSEIPVQTALPDHLMKNAWYPSRVGRRFP
jgi:hypothetical protein